MLVSNRYGAVMCLTAGAEDDDADISITSKQVQ